MACPARFDPVRAQHAAPLPICARSFLEILCAADGHNARRNRLPLDHQASEGRQERSLTTPEKEWFFQHSHFTTSHLLRQDVLAHLCLVPLELVKQLGIADAKDLHRQQTGIKRAANSHCGYRNALGHLHRRQ